MWGAQIIPWLNFSVPGIGHLAALSALVSASLVCLTSAVVSDPGRCALHPAAPQDVVCVCQACHFRLLSMSRAIGKIQISYVECICTSSAVRYRLEQIILYYCAPWPFKEPNYIANQADL